MEQKTWDKLTIHERIECKLLILECYPRSLLYFVISEIGFPFANFELLPCPSTIKNTLPIGRM